MGKISLFIDGTEIQAEEGMSVLEASLAAGIYIPHLCSHPDLPATGGCKMCVVEIDGQETPVSSCVTEVQEGMKVHTKSEQLSQLRKIALELIMLIRKTVPPVRNTATVSCRLCGSIWACSMPA